MKKNGCIKRNGFTLVELMVIVVILGILTAIAIPVYMNMSERAKIAADQESISNLNSVTLIYRFDNPDPGPFDDAASLDSELIQVLVSGGYLSDIAEPQTKDAAFSWDYQNKIWKLLFQDALYIISYADGVSVLTSQNRLQGSYSGSALDIVIPYTMSGLTVKEIYQDVFKGKNLTTVTFNDGSAITRIHARAFYKNELNNIILPNNLTRIDLWAFRDNNLTEIILPDKIKTIEQNAFDNNNITKITIGPDVTTIGDKVFMNNNDGFKAAYATGGAGTYLFVNGNWVKQ